MEQKDMVNSKLDSLLQANKAEYKLERAILDSQNNISLELSRKLENIDKKLDKILDIKQGIDKLEEKLEPKNYSGEEIYNMNKKGMSWQKMSRSLGIPVSTLQYHARKYRLGVETYITKRGV